MLPLLAAGWILVAAPQTVSLEPTDDIWVYSRASDPGKDEYLRVWGSGGKAVASSPDDSDNFSYGYLKFDLASVPKGRLVGAKLFLMHIADPGYSADYIKDNPLQARSLGSNFSEKSWEYDIVRTLSPGAAIYGAASPSSWPTGKPFPIEIDLTRGTGDFPNALAKAEASVDSVIAMALTSADDVQEMGSKSVYKVYSREAQNKANRPRLELTIEP